MEFPGPSSREQGVMGSCPSPPGEPSCGPGSRVPGVMGRLPVPPGFPLLPTLSSLVQASNLSSPGVKMSV